MKNNEKLFKVTSIAAKVIEKTLWICSLVVAVLFVCGLVTKNPAMIMDISSLSAGEELTCMGFEISVVAADGTIIVSAVLLFLVAAVFLMMLTAMIFRNIHLILKKAKDTTPFCEDVVRMIREIGIFFIATVVVGLIFSVIARIIIGADVAEISVGLERVFIGLTVICLSGIFSYGEELQNDVDGLL